MRVGVTYKRDTHGELAAGLQRLGLLAGLDAPQVDVARLAARGDQPPVGAERYRPSLHCTYAPSHQQRGFSKTVAVMVETVSPLRPRCKSGRTREGVDRADDVARLGVPDPDVAVHRARGNHCSLP